MIARRALRVVLFVACGCAPSRAAPPVEMAPIRNEPADASTTSYSFERTTTADPVMWEEDAGDPKNKIRHVLLKVGSSVTIPSQRMSDFQMFGPPVEGTQSADGKQLTLHAIAPGERLMLMIESDATQVTYVITVTQ